MIQLYLKTINYTAHFLYLKTKQELCFQKVKVKSHMTEDTYKDILMY